jgi:ABC-type multidrug transport system fused ATPase/permease subunit
LDRLLSELLPYSVLVLSFRLSGTVVKTLKNVIHIRMYSFELASSRISARLRHLVYKALLFHVCYYTDMLTLLRKDISFFDSSSTGALSGRVVYETVRIFLLSSKNLPFILLQQTLVTASIQQLATGVYQVVLTLGGFLALAIISYKLTLAISFLLPVYIIGKDSEFSAFSSFLFSWVHQRKIPPKSPKQIGWIHLRTGSHSHRSFSSNSHSEGIRPGNLGKSTIRQHASELMGNFARSFIFNQRF